MLQVLSCDAQPKNLRLKNKLDKICWVRCLRKKRPTYIQHWSYPSPPIPFIQCWGSRKRSATACEINARCCKLLCVLPSTLNAGDRGKNYMISWTFFISGVFFANTGTIIMVRYCCHIDDAPYIISEFLSYLLDSMLRVHPWHVIKQIWMKFRNEIWVLSGSRPNAAA